MDFKTTHRHQFPRSEFLLLRPPCGNRLARAGLPGSIHFLVCDTQRMRCHCHPSENPTLHIIHSECVKNTHLKNSCINLLENGASLLDFEFQMFFGSAWNCQRFLMSSVWFTAEIIRFRNFSAHVNLLICVIDSRVKWEEVKMRKCNLPM